MIEAYPLCWPLGQKRTDRPTYSRFGDHTLAASVKGLKLEIERMGGSNPIISSNIPVKANGDPHANYAKRIINDFGVAVYFTRKGKQVVLACDAWTCVEDNIWSIKCSIEAMRSLERWGVSEMLDRAFNGFTALPAAGQSQSRTCWDILGISITDDKEQIKKAYSKLAKTLHPDTGGNHNDMAELNEAYRDATSFADN